MRRMSDDDAVDHDVDRGAVERNRGGPWRERHPKLITVPDTVAPDQVSIDPNAASPRVRARDRPRADDGAMPLHVVRVDEEAIRPVAAAGQHVGQHLQAPRATRSGTLRRVYRLHVGTRAVDDRRVADEHQPRLRRRSCRGKMATRATPTSIGAQPVIPIAPVMPVALSDGVSIIPNGAADADPACAIVSGWPPTTASIRVAVSGFASTVSVSVAPPTPDAAFTRTPLRPLKTPTTRMTSTA